MALFLFYERNKTNSFPFKAAGNTACRGLCLGLYRNTRTINQRSGKCACVVENAYCHGCFGNFYGYFAPEFSA